MLDYHILFLGIDRNKLHSVFQCHIGMAAAVFRLMFFTADVVFTSVVVEKVVKQTCSCSRACVKSEKSAGYICVI